MPSERESQCCREIEATEYRRVEGNVQCLSHHPGFQANCTNRWVLEMSFHEFVQQEGPIGDEEPRHE